MHDYGLSMYRNKSKGCAKVTGKYGMKESVISISRSLKLVLTLALHMCLKKLYAESRKEKMFYSALANFSSIHSQCMHAWLNSLLPSFLCCPSETSSLFIPVWLFANIFVDLATRMPFYVLNPVIKGDLSWCLKCPRKAIFRYNA